MDSQSDARLRGLDEHIRAENDHDLDGIAASFAADAVLILNGQTFRGRELIRRVHEGFGFGESGAFAGIQIRVDARHVTAAGAIILEQTLSATHVGTWDGVPATGRAVEVGVCTVYELNDAGELSAERIYFDGASLLKQLRS